MNYGKRLCKSSTDRAICGVCGGIAQYFGIDSIIIRLLMVLFCLAFGSGLLFYIIAAIIMPSEEAAAYDQANFERYNQARSSQGGYYARYNAQYGGSQQYGETRSYEEKAAAAQDAEFTAEAAEGEAAPAGENASESAENAQQSAESGADGNNTEEAPKDSYRTNYEAYQARQQEEYQRQQSRQAAPRNNSGSKILGAVLLVIGASLILRYFIPRIPMILVWATIAIVVGVVLMLRRK